jgi:Uma2 family endonuclease
MPPPLLVVEVVSPNPEQEINDNLLQVFFSIIAEL